ncbi:MAG: hypothetical protein ACKOEM_08305 [Planctomycetia bacterium]
MTMPPLKDRVCNPFCTRSIRPGRIPPLDGSGRPLDVTALLASFDAFRGSAALVGPHGSGKTTLLWHLAAALAARGRRVERVRLSDGRGLVLLVAAVIRGVGGGVVCVDSWERLGRPWADLVRWIARAGGTRLLVTAHRPGRLPTLWICRTSPSLLASIVAGLPNGGALVSPEREQQIAEVFRLSAGDIRESLFALYDRFEERARAARLIESANA